VVYVLCLFSILAFCRHRIGINTDAVLVGNFGCDFRIAYTCLGDGVNLAARLEAANKPFGTVLLISEPTCKNAGEHYLTRKIAHVTVPGKAEVLPIYEVLCRNPAFAPNGPQPQPQPQPQQALSLPEASTPDHVLSDTEMGAVSPSGVSPLLVPFAGSTALSLSGINPYMLLCMLLVICIFSRNICGGFFPPLILLFLNTFLLFSSKCKTELSPKSADSTGTNILNHWRFLTMDQVTRLKQAYDKVNAIGVVMMLLM
jgi:hypothetical protein